MLHKLLKLSGVLNPTYYVVHRTALLAVPAECLAGLVLGYSAARASFTRGSHLVHTAPVRRDA